MENSPSQYVFRDTKAPVGCVEIGDEIICQQNLPAIKADEPLFEKLKKALLIVKFGFEVYSWRGI